MAWGVWYGFLRMPSDSGSAMKEPSRVIKSRRVVLTGVSGSDVFITLCKHTRYVVACLTPNFFNFFLGVNHLIPEYRGKKLSGVGV